MKIRETLNPKTPCRCLAKFRGAPRWEGWVWVTGTFPNFGVVSRYWSCYFDPMALIFGVPEEGGAE